MSFALSVAMPVATFRRLVPGSDHMFVVEPGLRQVLRAKRTSLDHNIETDEVLFRAVWDTEPDQKTMHAWYRFFPSEEPTIRMGVQSRT